MSAQEVNQENNNKEVKGRSDTTTKVKIIEVNTNANEIITIKKEPHDFFEYTACDTAAKADQLLEHDEEKEQSGSSNTIRDNHLVVRYQIEKWNSSDTSKTETETKRGNNTSSKSYNAFGNDEGDDLSDIVEDYDGQDTDISDFDENSEECDDIQISDFSPSPDATTQQVTQEASSPEPEDDEEEEISTTTEFNGMKIESKGQYSICPVCNKKIKSTFIFRHIKLHNQPSNKVDIQIYVVT